MLVNVAQIVTQSSIYGPGVRAVVWLQGCSLHCSGCWNKEMWSHAPHKLYTIDELWEALCLGEGQVEGVTLLGGEPLNQAIATRAIAKRAQSEGLSLVLFTGYELAEINDMGCADILNDVDILITGRYVESLRTLEHQWIGSTNQEIHFLSTRYDEQILHNTNYMELEIGEQGDISLLGFPDDEWREFVLSSS